MRTPLACLAGAVGVAAAAFSSPAPADSLKSVVRTLNAIVNPEDAWRLEDQARRLHRPDDAQYWHRYGEGLEQQRRARGEPVPPPGAQRQYSGPISPDEAHRLQDQARRYGQPNEEQYWSRYGQGGPQR